MCGILGILNFKSDINKYIDSFNKSLDFLNNRGPDNRAIWINQKRNILLGHRRLSIRDLSNNSNQPKFSKNKKFIISYNGEIYNSDKLLFNLQNKYNFHVDKDNSDTEILVNHLALFGIEHTLNIVKGMFAFALWDCENEKLYLARDRFGEKPLYYGFEDDNIFFSSELKPILNLFKKKCDYSVKSTELFLKLDFIPSPYSIFKNTFKLEPGSFLIFNKSSIKDLSNFNIFLNENIQLKGIIKKRYFSLYKEYGNFEKNKSSKINFLDIEKIIDDSVKKQIVSDVPLGCFLSGGIDSSVVAFSIAKYRNQFPTFTLGFDEKEYDERFYSKKIAKYLGSNHNEIVLKPNDMLDKMSQILNYFSEPFADASQLPTAILSSFASKSVKVVLTGDGGDELFGGYNRYFYAKKYKYFFRCLPFFARFQIGNLIKYLNFIFKSKKNDKIANKIQSIRKFEDLYLNLLANINPEERILIENKTYLKEWFEKIPYHKMSNYEELMQYYDLNYYLSDDILHKVDRSSMLSSLETRVPLLDYNVFKNSMKLSYNHKFDNRGGKIVLKSILEKYLPRNLIERKKTGFGVPIGKWMRKDLRSWSEDLIFSNNNGLEFINHDLYRNLWNEHLNGKDHQIALWPYLVLLNWNLNYKT